MSPCGPVAPVGPCGPVGPCAPNAPLEPKRTKDNTIASPFVGKPPETGVTVALW